MTPDRGLTRREVVLAALGALAISVVMNWPLPLHLFDTIPKDLGDPLPQAWQVAWGGHALATQPLDFFQSNQFWPERDSLAFGDALIGYAPAGLIGDGPDDAVARYNLLFLFAYALCFFGTYLLAREMGLGPGGAVVAGAAFAYAPFRMEQDGHMQVISSGGIPLALALAVRGIRLRRAWPLFGAWAVAAWQVSIGFAIGLPFAYLIALLRGDRRRGLVEARAPAPRAADGDRRRRGGAALRGGRRGHLAAVLPRRRPLHRGDAHGVGRRGVLGTDRGADPELRRELGLGRRDARHLLRDQQPSREDSLPGRW